MKRISKIDFNRVVPVLVLAAGVCACVAGLHTAAALENKSEDELSGNDFVKVRLALEKNAFLKTGVNHLAVVFDISPDWHLYWRNPGDSGLPPRITFKPIPGVTFGSPAWPIPVRHVGSGSLVDYVYERQLVLIYPVTVDAKFAGGDKLDLSADIDWLVCKEICLQGEGVARISVPVTGDLSTPSKDAPLFSTARSRLPKAAADSNVVETRWNGRELTLRVKDASSLTFYPYENDEGIHPEDMVKRGNAKSDTLRLQFPEEVSSLKQVAGVLVVIRRNINDYIEIRVDTPNAR